jgi:hypothetical protein
MASTTPGPGASRHHRAWYLQRSRDGRARAHAVIVGDVENVAIYFRDSAPTTQVRKRRRFPLPHEVTHDPTTPPCSRAARRGGGVHQPGACGNHCAPGDEPGGQLLPERGREPVQQRPDLTIALGFLKSTSSRTPDLRASGFGSRGSSCQVLVRCCCRALSRDARPLGDSESPLDRAESHAGTEVNS